MVCAESADLLQLQAVVQLLLFLFTSHKRSNKENDETVTQYCPFSSFSLSRRTSKSSTKSADSSSSSLHLDWDTLQEVISRLAYPVSQWADGTRDVAAKDKGSHTRRKRRS